MAALGTQTRAPSRILVLGCPGSGKTRLARELSARTGLPMRHLDDEYWGEDWTRPHPDDWETRQRKLVAADTWIIDGNYLPTIELRARRAQLIVLADAPTLHCLRRVVVRAWHIRRGRLLALPARVRAQAEAGMRVRATRDLAGLSWKVVRFRRRDWWATVTSARSNLSAPLIIGVGAGFTPWYLATLRWRLRRRRVAAVVVPLRAVAASICGLACTLPEGTALCEYSSAGRPRCPATSTRDIIFRRSASPPTCEAKATR